jgi:hypothetical protein
LQDEQPLHIVPRLKEKEIQPPKAEVNEREKRRVEELVALFLEKRRIKKQRETEPTPKPVERTPFCAPGVKLRKAKPWYKEYEFKKPMRPKQGNFLQRNAPPDMKVKDSVHIRESEREKLIDYIKRQKVRKQPLERKVDTQVRVKVEKEEEEEAEFEGRKFFENEIEVFPGRKREIERKKRKSVVEPSSFRVFDAFGDFLQKEEVLPTKKSSCSKIRLIEGCEIEYLEEIQLRIDNREFSIIKSNAKTITVNVLSLLNNESFRIQVASLQLIFDVLPLCLNSFAGVLPELIKSIVRLIHMENARITALGLRVLYELPSCFKAERLLGMICDFRESSPVLSFVAAVVERASQIPNDVVERLCRSSLSSACTYDVKVKHFCALIIKKCSDLNPKAVADFGRGLSREDRNEVNEFIQVYIPDLLPN